MDRGRGIWIQIQIRIRTQTKTWIRTRTKDPDSDRVISPFFHLRLPNFPILRFSDISTSKFPNDQSLDVNFLRPLSNPPIFQFPVLPISGYLSPIYRFTCGQFTIFSWANLLSFRGLFCLLFMDLFTSSF